MLQKGREPATCRKKEMTLPEHQILRAFGGTHGDFSPVDGCRENTDTKAQRPSGSDAGHETSITGCEGSRSSNSSSCFCQ